MDPRNKEVRDVLLEAQKILQLVSDTNVTQLEAIKQVVQEKDKAMEELVSSLDRVKKDLSRKETSEQANVLRARAAEKEASDLKK